jgi:uncharacterized membrane protein
MKQIAAVFMMMTLFSFALFAQSLDSLAEKKNTVKNDSVIDTTVVQKCIIAISTTPDSAVIVVDDSVRGLSPLKISNLKSGEHVILLKKKGYYQKKISVLVDSTQSQDLTFVLQQPATLMLTSTPAGSDVFINQENKGITPLNIPLLKPGAYSVQLKKEHYETFEKSITLVSGKKDTLDCILLINKAYVDSIKNEALRIKKNHSRIKTILISSAFFLFAIVIGSIELSGNK